MLSRLHLSAVLLVAALLWGVILLFEGVAVDGAWFSPFSMVVSALLLLLIVFDRWAWRLRLLQGWFVARPDLRGTWRVELQSGWENPETGNVIGPIIAYLAVRQTFSTLSVRLFTAESASELIASEITKAADGTYRLSAVYRNEPKLAVRDRSPIHYGAFVLQAQCNPITVLAGHYWTDRNSSGEIRTLARHVTIVGSFDDAKSLIPLAELAHGDQRR
jgi:hypothetical protein